MNMPLHYFGGKSAHNGTLAKWIISHFIDEPHTHYVETCFGGGSMLLYREKVDGLSEVVNDINGDLINFWKVLADRTTFEQFYTRISFLPLSEQLFKEAQSHIFGKDSVEDAVYYFILNRQSRLGTNKNFVTLSKRRTRRGISEQVNSWLQAIEGLPEVVDRLESVAIRNTDLLSLLRQEDTKETLFYLDPPYLHQTRGCKNAYKFEMTESQHTEMLDELEKIEGKFVLSGYDSDLYKKYATRNGWHVFRKQVSHSSSSSKKKEIKTEVIWLNYDPTPF
jgi:DNA adenine methylase